MTPREFDAFMSGRGRADKDALALSIAQAWHSANFYRAKQIPDLKSILSRIAGEPTRPQSPAEMLRIVEMLNAKFGGEDRRGERDKGAA